MAQFDKSKITTIIFDLDGTLADSFKLFIDIINPWLPWVGYRVVEEDELPRIKNMSMRQIRKLFDLNPLELLVIGVVYKYKLSGKLANAETFPKLEEVLKKLSARGYQLMILSSNSNKAIELFLQKHNFPKFEAKQGGAGVLSKRRAIERFLDKHNLNKNEVVYVGDEIKDLLSCQAAGIPIISVSWGFNSKELLRKYKPDYLANSPEELLEVLLK